VAHQSEGGAAEAESLFTRALAMEPPDSAEGATTMELYAKFLREQSRVDEAAPFEERAAGIRKANAAALSPKRPDMGPAQKISRTAGAEVVSPIVIEKPEPRYTQEARVAKVQGTVLVYVEIGTDGKACNMQVTKSIGLGLDESAVDTIAQWQFQPGTRGGVPVPVQATVQVNFRLL
jgi:TonB family protein